MTEARSLQETYAPHNECFGCGPANAKGLRIRSMLASEGLVCDFTPAPEHIAFPGVVNGGIFLLPPDSAPRLAGAATAFFEARKRPWRMASLIGPLALIRFAAGRLSVTDLEETARRLLHVPAHAVRGCAAELAFDVDTAAEYGYARALR